MTEENKSGGFSLANLIGIIWSIHILIAALIYPRPLLPSAENSKKYQIYKLLSFLAGTLILFINVGAIIALFTRPSFLEAGKVLFIYLCWLAIGIIYILFNHLVDIHLLFSALEEEAVQGRDQSVMLIRAGQAALKAGNTKLFGDRDVQFSLSSLLKKIGPLALLFLRKEKNLLHIAIEAGRAIFAGSMLFKNLF